jgi:integrase
MASERLLTEPDIQELVDKNAAPPYGKRNAALIMGAVYWGLTPSELSLVSVQDVMHENGELLRIWVIPAHVAFNGEPRECYTENHVISKGWGTSNMHTFRGLDPLSKFFLNDRGEPYKMSPRIAGSGQYQPRSMNEQLKRVISRTNLHGATPSSFRDSYIRGLYENGCGWKDLMKLTGIKQKRTLERKVRPQEAELEEIFHNLFSRVKNPV